MDYKEELSTSYGQLVEKIRGAKCATYSERRANALLLRAIPDGRSCPRAFAAWCEKHQALVKLA